MKASVSAARNSCFALISALEEDLRALAKNLADAANTDDILPSDVRQVAVTRWQSDNRSSPSGHAENDLELLQYVDFLDLAKTLHRLRKSPAEVHVDVKWLAEQLEPLAPTRNRVCHSRPLEPEDLTRCVDAAGRILNEVPHADLPTLKDTVERLSTNPQSVLGVQIPSFWAEDTPVHHNLPLAEFDDTGFLGRDQDRRQVLTLLRSHYPVVTIVGEGGVGKTALALRCLYDLLDEPSQPYDAFVWTSLKTTALTVFGLTELAGAIGSTIGLLGDITRHFGPTDADADEQSLTDEIIEFLGEYRVLLAIDNLETISGRHIRGLLSRVPRDSKVLITSRVGLGEFETRYALDSLDQPTASALMRRFARVMGQSVIAKSENSIVNRYCSRLFNNPLLIKWFVSGVAQGADPNSLLNKKGDKFSDALSFCFTHLFDHLGDSELRIVTTLASAGRSLSATELSYLNNDLPPADIEWSLGILHNSSMVRRQPAADSFSYVLTDSAYSYMSSYRPPSKSQYTRIQQQLRKLRQIAEHERLVQAQYRYEIFTVRTRSRDERIAGAFLRQALDAQKNGDIDSARDYVASAKRLLPTYAEAYRIAGLVESRDGNIFRAAEELEQAIQYDPESGISRYTYAQFLIRELEDFERALEQLEAAVKVDSDDPTLLGAIAMCLNRLGEYPRAAELYARLLQSVSQRPRKWRIATCDQAADCFTRWAERDYANKDGAAGGDHVQRALGILLDAAKSGNCDDQTGVRVGKTMRIALLYAIQSADVDSAEQVVSAVAEIVKLLPRRRIAVYGVNRLVESFAGHRDLQDRIAAMCHATGKEPEGAPVRGFAEGTFDSDVRREGRIKSLPEGVRYGFILDEQDQTWFFHQNRLVDKSDWPVLKYRTRVSFKIGSNDQGRCAVAVRRT